MTPDPETVTPEATLSEVWELMRERRIRHVPVIEDGVLVGMLSDRDVLFAAAEGRIDRRGSVVGVMTSDVLAVEPDSELSEVISIMLEGQVGAVPVIRTGTREVVGIVSYVDVLRAAQDLFEEE